MQPHGGGVLLIASLALIGFAAPTLPAFESEQTRFLPSGRVLDGGADWVSSNRDRLAFGSGKRVTIATLHPTLRLETVWSLDRPATAGLVIGSDLYLVRQSDAGDELVVADLTSADPAPRRVPLDPAPRGSLRIAQMDDYLLVAENGLGVRVLQLPVHRHAGAADHGHDAAALAAIGLLAIDEPIHALGVSFRSIYLATKEHLVEINASVPSVPIVARRIPLERGVHALGANNNTVYLLGDDGLRTLDLSQAGASPSATLDPGVQGRSLLALGRTVYVAGGTVGLQRFQDSSTRAAIFVVAVGNNFFMPAALSVNVNDTVQWQKPDTLIVPHNVFSCNALEPSCNGNAAEVFTSGTPVTTAFTFSHTFVRQGNNPYLCQVHTIFMLGEITVGAAPTGPPGVPDGSGGLAPMRVSKLNAGGVTLGVQFDTSCPDAVNRNLIFGNRGTLPTVAGGTYNPSGSRCAIGASPFIWGLTPSVPPGDFLWWLLVADDGVSVEGSWGQGDNAERNGPGINGSSGLCGNFDKDLTNTCGQ